MVQESWLSWESTWRVSMKVKGQTLVPMSIAWPGRYRPVIALLWRQSQEGSLGLAGHLMELNR